MSLTPEERQRIYEEEKERLEAAEGTQTETFFPRLQRRDSGAPSCNAQAEKNSKFVQPTFNPHRVMRMLLVALPGFALFLIFVTSLLRPPAYTNVPSSGEPDAHHDSIAPAATAKLSEAPPMPARSHRKPASADSAPAEESKTASVSEAQASISQTETIVGTGDLEVDRAAFLEGMRSGGITEDVIVSVGRGVVDDDLKITVGNAWRGQPFQTRLQVAQLLWKSWARIHSPNDLDKSKISLVDINDNSVGGSSDFAGSVVKVDE